MSYDARLYEQPSQFAWLQRNRGVRGPGASHPCSACRRLLGKGKGEFGDQANPGGFRLTPGQAPDLEGVEALLSGLQAVLVLADRVYGAEERVIRPLYEAGLEPVIPARPTADTTPSRYSPLQGSQPH